MKLYTCASLRPRLRAMREIWSTLGLSTEPSAFSSISITWGEMAFVLCGVSERRWRGPQST